jgi:hypothetical protein
LTVTENGIQGKRSLPESVIEIEDGRRELGGIVQSDSLNKLKKRYRGSFGRRDDVVYIKV